MSRHLKARAIWLACRAANSAQLGACYREEAGRLLRKAHDLDGDYDWSVDEDGHASPTGLPDDWTGVAELDEDEAIRLLMAG